MKFLFQVISIAIISLVVFISSCVHDPVLPESYKSDTPIFTGDCSPDTLYFSRDIAPIFNANCATSNCHDAATAQDGVDLSTYSQIIKTGKVKPYNASDSEIIEVLTKNGEDQMPPPPATHLPSDVIALLEKWINQGALNLECEDINVVCDSVNMSYTDDILPILNVSCVSCHSAPSPGGGIDLSSYANIKTQVDKGKLMGAIEHKSGFVPMPQGGGKLGNCDISKLNGWITDGASNN